MKKHKAETASVSRSGTGCFKKCQPISGRDRQLNPDF